MDFSAWSPSHLIVAGLAFATIIGQTIAVLTRLKTTTERLEKQGEMFVHTIEQLDKRVDEARTEVSTQVEKQGEMFVHAMERLENRVDKRIDEVRSELSEIRSELSKLNQNHIDHLSHHQHRTED